MYQCLTGSASVFSSSAINLLIYLYNQSEPTIKLEDVNTTPLRHWPYLRGQVLNSQYRSLSELANANKDLRYMSSASLLGMAEAINIYRELEGDANWYLKH
jgi:hypothetical protein